MTKSSLIKEAKSDLNTIKKSSRKVSEIAATILGWIFAIVIVLYVTGILPSLILGTLIAVGTVAAIGGILVAVILGTMGSLLFEILWVFYYRLHQLRTN